MKTIAGSSSVAPCSQQSLPLESFESLLKRFEPNIKRSARRLLRVRRHSAADMADLVQAGRIALWNAYRAFDPAAGTPFEHYAHSAIAHAVSQEAGQEDSHWDIVMRGELPQSDEGGEAEPKNRNYVPENTIVTSAMFEGLLNDIHGWTDQQQIVFHHHLLLGNGQKEIAAMLSVSQQRVATIKVQVTDLILSHLELTLH